MTAFVTRFAPSPTGFLHLGHAFSALTAFRIARARGGRFLLRIEDIDAGRCRPEFEAAILEDLRWLGLAWEEPVRRQSERLADYAGVVARLVEEGLAYRCFRTRRETLDEIARAPHLAPSGPEGPVFFGAPLDPAEEEERLASGAPYALRLSIVAARRRLGAALDALTYTEEMADGSMRRVPVRAGLFGDAVIARKDAGASYHLAATHDDAIAGVTHVIRGEDLAPAAHLHRVLQALAGWPAPVYRHHRLVTDETGRRLAKRDKAATLRSLRESGVTPAEIEARLFGDGARG